MSIKALNHKDTESQMLMASENIFHGKRSVFLLACRCSGKPIKNSVALLFPSYTSSFCHGGKDYFYFRGNIFS
ncbi:hypothetical protein [Endozoicomonas sp. ONNA2]|uniref:hypothetical protein n=1 Tax=Endozoicomonas sp. ONNA2 TaxID=2828741 RepID=UPI002149232E|nr:hypothetical protein [Endozoicomonas sp. ONNA2]